MFDVVNEPARSLKKHFKAILTMMRDARRYVLEIVQVLRLIYFCAPSAGTYTATRTWTHKFSKPLNHNLLDRERISMSELKPSSLIVVKSNREFIDLKPVQFVSIEILFFSFEKCVSLPRESWNVSQLAKRPVNKFASILMCSYVDSNFGAATEKIDAN